MDKKQQILREIGEEDAINSKTRHVLDCLDKYTVEPPSSEATRLLIQRLQPILAENTKNMRFRDVLTHTRHNTSFPVILQLIGPQTTLLSRWFVVLTIGFLASGLMLTNAFGSDLLKFLVNAAPILGVLTYFYECRAHLYKVGEMEAACLYTPAQLATARVLVVLGYNVILCTAATLVVEASYNIVVWKLLLNWLAPLLLILGIALCSALQFGVAGGCVTAGVVWIAQIALLDGNLFLSILLPNLTGVITDFVSMLLGGILIYISLRTIQSEERILQAR